MLRVLEFIRKNGKNQAHNSNRAILEKALSLGFDPPAVRSALFSLNQINPYKIESDISKTTLYAAVGGRSRHRGAQQVLAAALGLTREELFPDTGNGGAG
jgi:hypothetical protein